MPPPPPIPTPPILAGCGGRTVRIPDTELSPLGSRGAPGSPLTPGLGAVSYVPPGPSTMTWSVSLTGASGGGREEQVPCSVPRPLLDTNKEPPVGEGCGLSCVPRAQSEERAAGMPCVCLPLAQFWSLASWLVGGGSLDLAAGSPKVPGVPRGGRMHGGGVPAAGGVGQHELYQWMGV